MKDKIIELIKESCALDEKISGETLFTEISIDSLSFITLIVNIENTFNIEFEDEELNIYDWNTVGDIIKFVEKKANGK